MDKQAIDLKDIKVGDKIEIVTGPLAFRDYTVEDRYTGVVSSKGDRSLKLGHSSFLIRPDRTFYLLDRPKPELPKDRPFVGRAGGVVRVFFWDAGLEWYRWMSSISGKPVTSAGYPEGMVEFIRDIDMSVED